MLVYFTVFHHFFLNRTTSKVQLWSSLKIRIVFRYHFLAKPKGHAKDQIKHSVLSEKSNNLN